jgi:hypothetical protein
VPLIAHILPEIKKIIFIHNNNVAKYNVKQDWSVVGTKLAY